ncbi:hypothetical protein J6590_055792 [Homalodisca vitripennis]|nr:hypothetical protein J6590_055792 [Homalodisca vitripennis]
MKTALPLIAVLASFLCLASDRVNAAPSPPEPAGHTFFDRIFNIPRSVLNSVNKELNDNGVKCKDGSLPEDKDGKGTCHDNALGYNVWMDVLATTLLLDWLAAGAKTCLRNFACYLSSCSNSTTLSAKYSSRMTLFRH